jgi:hypothetical protein
LSPSRPLESSGTILQCSVPFHGCTRGESTSDVTLSASVGDNSEVKDIIIKATQERSGLRGVQLTFGVDRHTLRLDQKKADGFPDLNSTLTPPKPDDRVLELDELWSFVHDKNQCWIWIALCAVTKQVVAVVAGDQSTQTCRALW